MLGFGGINFLGIVQATRQQNDTTASLQRDVALWRGRAAAAEHDARLAQADTRELLAQLAAQRAAAVAAAEQHADAECRIQVCQNA